MKKSNMILAICIVFICVLGWLKFGSQVFKERNLYSEHIEKADEWVGRGLYQRAIVNYDLALDENATEELYLKTNAAFELRYEETPDETIKDYIDFLEKAVKAYPGNQVLVDSFVAIHTVESRYEEIYNCLINAIKNGYDSEQVRAELRKARYAFDLKTGEFSDLKQTTGNYYIMKRKEGWNLYSMEEGYIFPVEYEYMSPANKEGTVIATGNDSRLLDATGMVLGIFKGKVTDASVYSENLVAACVDGIYSYYDEFADKQFGEYEMAGTFQNDKAAVQKDGKWMLIDGKGEIVSGTFDEIVLNYVGQYLINNLMLAKSNGVYGLYDKDCNLKVELVASDVDVLTGDGVIAIEKDDKWGFVNTNGEIVIEPAFEEAKSFAYGLAAVKKDGKWGFIDRDGNVVIECQFSDVGYMAGNGICPVRTDMPEEKIDLETEENLEVIEVEVITEEIKSVEEMPEIVETTEIWKLLQLVIGIKEN